MTATLKSQSGKKSVVKDVRGVGEREEAELSDGLMPHLDENQKTTSAGNTPQKMRNHCSWKVNRRQD